MAQASRRTSVTRQMRYGEVGSVPPRSRRVYQTGSGQWFFKTREGALIGAFRNEWEAEKGVQDFVDFMVAAAPDVVARFTEHLCFDASDVRFRELQSQASNLG